MYSFLKKLLLNATSLFKNAVNNFCNFIKMVVTGTVIFKFFKKQDFVMIAYWITNKMYPVTKINKSNNSGNEIKHSKMIKIVNFVKIFNKKINIK